MTHLFLIRHGETDWNVEGRWQGQADVPLNARGRAQAARMAETLRGLDLQAIYASDLVRARETAEALAAVHGLEVRLDARLREIHQGEWQGLLVGEIEARYAARFHERRRDPLNVAPPGGETVAGVQARVVAFLQEVVARHPGQTLAIVAHGFVLAVALVVYRQRPIDEVWQLIPENGVPVELDIPDARPAGCSGGGD
ncbi:MAG: histidine phosphatase family protein [Anaerolineales bacterium]|nr:histidine phosphatase family protein [Anaerolineales bacterium]